MDTSSDIAKHALDSKTATALFAFRKKYAYAERRRRIINSWWLIEMILALRTGQAEKRIVHRGRGHEHSVGQMQVISFRIGTNLNINGACEIFMRVVSTYMPVGRHGSPKV